MPSQRATATAGLWISPSPLQAPVGAYTLADDAVINSPGIIESRRGYFWLPYELSAPDIVWPKTDFSFGGTLMVQHGAKLAYNSGAAMVDYAQDFTPPAPSLLRMRSEEMGLNVYFTSDTGVYGIDVPTNQPRASGLPIGPMPTSILNATGLTGEPDTGWLSVNNQTGYVTTFYREDAHGTSYESTPSNPIFVINPQNITVPAGDATRPGTIHTLLYVQIGYVNHGFKNGDRVVALFNAPDVGYISGTYTVSDVTPNSFYIKAGGIPLVPDATTEPAIIYSGFKNVQVYVQLPAHAAADDTILVYRTYASDSATVFPRAQYYLNKEYVLTAGDITAGYFTYTDTTPDALLQDPLYTNTDDGEPPDSSLQNDNSQAPFCTDLAEFDQRLWGANYEELETFTLSLLGTGSPNGLQAGDTISILSDAGTATFTAVAEASTPTGNEFRVYTASSSPGDNVRHTAQELALAVSSQAVVDVAAYYTSGPEDIPGQMLLRSRVPGGEPFSVYASRISAWSPILTTSSVDALSSTSDPQTNGLWFSKQNQPESVPLLNRLSIGPRNCTILRIRPLRDKLFVFTDIAGCYVVSNSYPYQVTSLDSTAILVAPDTLVNFDGAIYALTTQGVVRFNEAGPTILSVPIESEIKALFGVGLTILKKCAFGIGYESYRKYMLCMPTTVEDTTNTQVWVYDVITKSWTRYTKSMDAGVVIPQTDALYVTTPRSAKVSVERKNYDRTDYSDEDFQVLITAATDAVVSVTSTIALVAGDLLYQSPITRSLITEVESTGINTYAVTTLDTVTWTLATATNYPGIPCQLLNTPLFASGPEQRKNFREVTYHFRTPGFTLGNGLFAGDTNPEIIEVAFSKGGWGEVPFGMFAWEQPARPVNKRVSIPTGARRVSYLSVGFSLREAQAQWQLMGVTPIYEGMSERNTK